MRNDVITTRPYETQKNGGLRVLATAIKLLLVNGLQLKSCVIVNNEEGEE